MDYLDEEYRLEKETVIKKFLPVALLFLAVYCPVSFFVLNDNLSGWTQLLSIVFILICLPVFYRTKNITLISNMIAWLNIPVMIPWLFTGGPSGAGYWWSPIYIIWVFYLTERRWAIFWSVMHVILSGIIVLLSFFGVLKIAYFYTEMLNILFAYSITFFIVYLFTKIHGQYFSRIAEELRQRRRIEDTLRKKSDKLYELNQNLKTAEGVIKSSEEELAQAKVTEKFARMLEYKNKQLLDFCHIISHNFRGPLGSINTLVDFASDTQNPDEKKDIYDKIKNLSTYLKEVFDEMVESIQVGQDTEIKSEEINLQKCLDNVLMGFESQIHMANAKIESDFGEVPMVKYPRKYIESIFANFISNSLKYKSPERTPRIRIQSKMINNSAHLIYADNGMGLDMQLHKDNLFKLRKVFHKHPESKGFGLFMTKTQVESMGGKIWAESEPDKGITFYLEFKAEAETD